MTGGLETSDSLLRRARWISTPRHHPLAMALIRCLAPLYLRWGFKLTRVELAPEDAARLRALRGQRVMLSPNHPGFDPVVMFQVSARLKMAFYYLTARELFDSLLNAVVIANVGAYAVERGAHDSDAMNTTRRLLCEGRHFVVIFPEGEAHYLYDTVLPFLPGAAKLGLLALSDLAQHGEPPPVYLVPVALRYHYPQDMRRAMLASLARLERRLGLRPPDPPLGWHGRLGRIAGHVLESNENALGIEPADTRDLQARLDHLRELTLARAATALGIEIPPPGQPLRNRLRKIIVAARRISHSPPQRGGAYAWRLYRRRQLHTGLLQRELYRVVDYVSLTGTYSYDVPTVENFLDVLGRLELEVLGKARYWGPRAVRVCIGEPLDLRAYLPQFRTNPEQACSEAMRVVEQRVHELLGSTASLMTPLPPLA